MAELIGPALAQDSGRATAPGRPRMDLRRAARSLRVQSAVLILLMDSSSRRSLDVTTTLTDFMRIRSLLEIASP